MTAVRDLVTLLALCAALMLASCGEPIAAPRPAWSVECAR